MLYKKLFELSGLSNHEITKRLNISHTERIQFENRQTINVDRFVKFAKDLQIEQSKLAEMVVNEIKEKYCG